MSTAQQASEPDPAEDGVLYEDQVAPEYGILGLTLREFLIVGAWLLAFILSFFPVFFTGPSIWGLGLEWVLPIGVPTVAVFLIVLRRFSPDGIRRVGSLGIDQFASVAFSVAAVYWAQQVWSGTAATIASGLYLLGWVPILQLLLSLALVVFTVFAPLVPGLREDFQGRMETLAHRNANPVRPVIARPHPVQAPTEATATTPATVDAPAAVDEPDDAEQVDAIDRDTDATHVFGAPLLTPQVGSASHASAGDMGTSVSISESDYVPGYARRSRRRDDDEPAEDTAGESAADDARADGATADEDTTDEAGTDEARADDAHDDAAGEQTRGDQRDDGFDESPLFGALSETLVIRDDSDGADDRSWDQTDESDLDDSRNVGQPFWILAGSERDVHDENGEPLFRIGPTAWTLVIEDRDGAYVVRHDDGRIGYLHDIADITKG